MTKRTFSAEDLENFMVATSTLQKAGLIDNEVAISITQKIQAMNADVAQQIHTVTQPRNSLFMALSDDDSIRKDVPVPQESESQLRVRELFGSDFFGISEVAGSYHYPFSEEELENRKSVRILGRDGSLLSEERSWDLIHRCHEEAPGQFVCCAGVPHSVFDIYKKHRDVFHHQSDHPQGLPDRMWTEDRLVDYWFLLAKDVIPKSYDILKPAKQEQWLHNEHPHRRFALPIHLVYGSVLCYKASDGQVLLYSSEKWGRTLQHDDKGRLVRVMFYQDHFLKAGLMMDKWINDKFWTGYNGIPTLWTSES